MPTPSKLDSNQVLQSAFDDGTASLRTTATVAMDSAVLDVAIDDTTDSIKIGNGSGSFADVSGGALKVQADDLTSIDAKLGRTTQPQIITSGNMAFNINSTSVDISLYSCFSIQAVFTGSPVGTFNLQCSNDVSPTNWTDIADSYQGVSAAGSVAWNVSNAGYRHVRVVYLASSGSGTANAMFFGKGA